MNVDRIIIIGAGVGGLVAAMLLAATGRAVVVLEKQQSTGGKLRRVIAAGQEIDAGPTVLTLRPVFEEIFAACDLALSDHVTLIPASLLARHAWSAEVRLDLFADRRRSADAIGAFAGAAAARGYLDFCAHARSVYETMNPLFMRTERPTPVGMVKSAGFSGLRGLINSAPFTTLWDSLATYFQDPRLRQLFARYATYCGSSPFQAPATLALVAHVEQEGVWLPVGGMAAFAEALTKAAVACGAEIRTGRAVRRIGVAGGRVSGVELVDGEFLSASAVVSNSDVGALAAGIFGTDAQRSVASDASLPRSLSALTWGMSARVEGFPLAHHTVLFSRNYAQEFEDIFTGCKPPREPTVYLCASDRSDDGARVGQGPERLFSIVNAPADAGRSVGNPRELLQCQEAMMRTLGRCGLRLSVEGEAHTGPAQFADLFPATEGALYGMASHGWTASFRRPGSRSKLPGLYLAGGSVHPGPGLPMAALSGRAAALAVLQDHP
jgi:1-hydroxycarotenoid 3,4-desaturase